MSKSSSSTSIMIEDAEKFSPSPPSSRSYWKLPQRIFGFTARNSRLPRPVVDDSVDSDKLHRDGTVLFQVKFSRDAENALANKTAPSLLDKNTSTEKEEEEETIRTQLDDETMDFPPCFTYGKWLEEEGRREVILNQFYRNGCVGRCGAGCRSDEVPTYNNFPAKLGLKRNETTGKVQWGERQYNFMSWNFSDAEDAQPNSFGFRMKSIGTQDATCYRGCWNHDLCTFAFFCPASVQFVHPVGDDHAHAPHPMPDAGLPEDEKFKLWLRERKAEGHFRNRGQKVQEDEDREEDINNSSTAVPKKSMSWKEFRDTLDPGQVCRGATYWRAAADYVKSIVNAGRCPAGHARDATSWWSDRDSENVSEKSFYHYQSTT